MAELNDLNLNNNLYLDVVEPTEGEIETPAETFTSGDIDGDLNLVGGLIQSSNFVSGSAGWQLTPTSGEINFALSVSSIDIPDTTTSNSFHVESDGDTFWGATNADFTSDNDNANAFILKDGTAKFQSITVGGTTRQYTISDDGIFNFGDGSDGALTTVGDVTLTEDKYFTNLTVSTGDTIFPAGFRIFVSEILTLAGTGKITRNGVAGGNGGDGTDGVGVNPGTGGSGGSAGTALADGYLKGSLAGTAGGAGGDGSTGNANAGSNSSAGTNTSNSIGSDGSIGGAGGAGGRGDGSGGGTASAAGGTAGAAGTRTISNVKLIANWHLATLLDIATSGSTIKFDNSASSTGGGGGGGGAGETLGGAGGGGGGGGAGGSGSIGGIIAIYAKEIIIGASSSIEATGGNGGNGGNGGDGATGTSHGTGGGAGGGGAASGVGGQIILAFNKLTNNGSITVAAGTAGTAGTGGTGVEGTLNIGAADGAPGSNGTAGASGNFRSFNLSL